MLEATPLIPNAEAPEPTAVVTLGEPEGPNATPAALTKEESHQGFFEKIGGSLMKLVPGGDRALAEEAQAKETEAAAIREQLPAAEQTERKPDDGINAIQAENAALKAQIALLTATQAAPATPAEQPEPAPEALNGWQLKVLADVGDGIDPDSRDYLAKRYETVALYQQAKTALGDAPENAAKVATYDQYLLQVEEEIRRERKSVDQAIRLQELAAKVEADKHLPYDHKPMVTQALDTVVGELADKLPRVAHALADPERRKVFAQRLESLPVNSDKQFWELAEVMLLDAEAFLPAVEPAKPEPKAPIDPSTGLRNFRDALKTSNEAKKPMTSAKSRDTFFSLITQAT